MMPAWTAYLLVALGVAFVVLLVVFVVKAAILFYQAARQNTPLENLVMLLTLRWLLSSSDDGDLGGDE